MVLHLKYYGNTLLFDIFFSNTYLYWLISKSYDQLKFLAVLSAIKKKHFDSCFASSKNIYLFSLFKIFYLFILERHRERGRDTGRGRTRTSHGGRWMWDSIPGLQDHALSQRQTLNHWAPQASLKIFKVEYGEMQLSDKNIGYPNN